jgi:3-hydroxymyristoyl/3-hydroxydecanoyl-(acyl carrier protein) dehydratase
MPAVVTLDRGKCLEFARGSVGLALGPMFSEIDKLPSRVRLPDEPMMFVDRVTKLEGKPLSLSSGRVVTEHEVKAGQWCLEEGHLTPGMSIESGQADLLLSAWLGVDLATEGLSQYRLLDAQVVFHRDPPAIGETAAYDIRLINFFSHADTRMFRFEFDGTVDGIPLLSMRRGCAGFFTQKALSEGKGLAKKEPEKSAPASVHPPLVSLLEDKTPTPPIFPRDLEAIRDGQLAIFGPSFEKLKLEAPPLTLPSGNLALIDAIPKIAWDGGAYGAGFVRAEAVIEPDAWFLACHFPGDHVMPGTLMYDACLQTLRAYLLSLGWVGLKGQCAFAPVLGLAQSLRCRGQVTPATNMVAYEAHVKKIGLTPPSDLDPGGEPYAIADAIMWADGRPIVECLDLGLRLSGLTMEALQAQWTFKRSRGRPKGSLGAKKLQLLEQQAAAPPPPPKTETVVRRQAKKAEPAPAPGSVSVRRPARSYEVFDKDMLTEMSTGVLSSVLGPAYARYDDGRFVARLPKAPYDFIDEAVIRKGRLGQVATGTQVEAFWKPSLGDRAWVLDEAGGDPPRLPYAAINEIALQPCGFLAAYMGSALAFQGPMRFRNLGGEAYIRSLAEPLGVMIQTRATLTKASVLGSMTIQHYQFTCHHGGRPLYEGQTHFGFHNPESLDRQSGLKANPGLLKALTSAAAASGTPMDFPEGPAWPSKRLAMLDTVVIDDKGDGRAWGRAKVDPKAWFFEAHFPGDPVWPGSLGLEAFLQLAKVLAARIFEPEVPLAEIKASWRSPELDTVHRWLYRGQIVPKNREVTLGIKVTNLDHLKKSLTLKGLLWVDDLVVYQVEEFTVAMAGPKVPGRSSS